ncbi:hypothetical protein D9757_005884 [Collybiopsis confluens]|uniref:Uncharacterized protein n=1 Tax=Collybiopsis confluens TaxID=2823264 RepID=A0A8H5MA92_9AGAR|nr:hypothetical protein D9757_005884 [Collybiopsis confluens]
MEEGESPSWRVYILRSSNLHILHRKGTNGWKPLVSVSVNHHLGHNHCPIYEISLGKDGQNPQSKLDWVEIEKPHAKTKLLFEIIHSPLASKKKARRMNRTVLASCEYEMYELVKLARERGSGHDSKKWITLCLTPSGSTPRTKRTTRTGPTAPSLHVRLCPPTGVPLELASDGSVVGLPDCEEEEDHYDGETDMDESSSVSSRTLKDESIIISPAEPLPPHPTESTLRKRRRRVRRRVLSGYALNSDEEEEGEQWVSESETDTDTESTRGRDSTLLDGDGDSSYVLKDHEEEQQQEEDNSSWSPWSWVDHVVPILGILGMSQPSILPSHLNDKTRAAEQEFQEEGSDWEWEWEWWERTLSFFTVYKELRIAEFEEHQLASSSSPGTDSALAMQYVRARYDRIYQRLQAEWSYVGGLLIGLAAIDAAIFAISPSPDNNVDVVASDAMSGAMLSSSLFPVDAYARSAVSMSTISTALGLVSVTWFLLYYGWGDVEAFLNRARPYSLNISGTPSPSRSSSQSNTVPSSLSRPSSPGLPPLQFQSVSAVSQPPQSSAAATAAAANAQSWGYFALSSRIPALCMLLSILFLVTFLLIVACAAAPPSGLLFLGVFFGMGMGMRYVVKLIRAIARAVRWVVKGVGSVAGMVGSRVKKGLGWSAGDGAGAGEISQDIPKVEEQNQDGDGEKVKRPIPAKTK